MRVGAEEEEAFRGVVGSPGSTVDTSEACHYDDSWGSCRAGSATYPAA